MENAINRLNKISNQFLQGAWNLTKAFLAPVTSASKLAGVSSTAEATENRATSAAKTTFIVEEVWGLFVDLRREHTEPMDFVSGGNCLIRQFRSREIGHRLCDIVGYKQTNTISTKSLVNF